MREAELSSGEESIIVVPDILYGNDSWRRTKILIIDDDKSFREALAESVRDFGRDVVESERRAGSVQVD